MSPSLTLVAFLLAGGLGGPGQEPVAAEPISSSFANAWKDGRFSIAGRYRWEEVTEDPAADSAPAAKRRARASTLRTVLGYETGTWRGWSLFLEATDVTAIGADAYANNGAGSLGNGVTGVPVIADPELTEISQFSIDYRRQGYRLSAGRRALSWGDQRFVGPVGWRQNHQEFDALILGVEPAQRFRLDYAFVDRVHRVTGEEQPMSSHLLQGELEVGPRDTLYGYSFWLDYDRAAQRSLSIVTSGLRWSGKRQVAAGVQLHYEAEAAEQREGAGRPGVLDLGYRQLVVGVEWRGPGVTLEAGSELLEGDGASGFATPLATLHLWNGFADQFLRTPPNGLRDDHVSISGSHGPVSWLMVYRRFTADRGAADYGSELDARAVVRGPGSFRFGVKAAFYEAEDFGTDTEKIWVWSEWGF